MPSRLTNDQNGVLVLGVLSGLLAFGISSMAGANHSPAISEPLHGMVQQEVVALPPAPEPARMAPSAIIMNQRATVRVDDGTVKFFFETGKSEVAQGAEHALKDILAAANNVHHLQIAGFHDSIGDPQSNAALVTQRAIAVKNTLMQLGVSDARIQLRQPEITAATGSNAQARRVEVSLLPDPLQHP